MPESATELTGSNQSSFDAVLAEIQKIGGSNPLRHFVDNSFGQVNLDRAHPGGLAQFVTGRPTLLSNLIRDQLSFSRAFSAAKRIKARQQHLSDQFGLETLFMASGLVDFSPDGPELRMPILLWPVNMLKKADDFELSLSRKAVVNPALAPALKEAYGVRLNNEDLLSQVQVGSDPIPVRILDHISSLIESVGSPELKRTLVISNFTSAALDLEADFRKIENPILNRLLHPESSGQDFVAAGFADPILVTDADHVQTTVVSKALAGNSFAVETLPGCGYLQTVVLTLAALAHSGKRALVLAPRRQTLNELADRLAQVGLPGLGIRSSSTWLDLISAISRNERATPDNYSGVLTNRDLAREQVANYFLALNARDGELGVSIADALEALSALAALPKPPTNEGRIEADSLGRHRDKAFALTLLKQAADLGEFDFGPEDSTWFRARFEHAGEIEPRIALAKSLSQTVFDKLAEQLSEFTKTVDFKPAQSVGEWVSYLELFVGIRDSLDRFKPEVFDRPVTELILATAPRKDKSVMSGPNRRRLKKLAKEYLRPGMHVGDLHQALKKIQTQREAWQRSCLVNKPPQVPQGIREAQESLANFVSDLALLQEHLDDSFGQLVDLPVDQLKSTLRSLAEDTRVLENYAERKMTEQRLDEAGLGPLSRELSRIHASRDSLANELELAWWKSALETLLARNQQTLTGNWEQIVKGEENFAEIESNLIQESSKAVANVLASKWKEALTRYPSESQTLRELLKLRRAVLAEIGQLAPNVYQALAPVVMLSPYEVPTALAKNELFDTVLVLDGAGSSIAENYSGLIRASQLIVFGDDVIAAATGFQLQCVQNPPILKDLPDSVFRIAKSALPVESLHHSYRTAGQVLGEYVNREFYGNQITFEPTANAYFGRSNVQFEKVNNPTAQTEAPEAEVATTLELIFNHALWHPEDSLLVATASEGEAERLELALQLEMRNRAHLAEFFEGHGRERFEITTLRDLSHRIADRIIFAVGFSKSSAGEYPTQLGQLGQEESRRWLANLIVSARKQFTLVSCFEPSDLSKSPLAGSEILHELLVEILRPAKNSYELKVNPMISDLAIRLTKLGVSTRTNFSDRIAMAVSFGQRAAVIEPDWAILGDTISDRHRGRPKLLRAMGWEYYRIPSFELFADPQSVAIRIAESLGVEVSKKPQPLFEYSEPAFDDTAAAWQDADDSNDFRLEQDRPPHWG